MIERIEPALEIAGGDDALVILRRAVDIVVVVIEASFRQHLGLMRFEHPQRHAGFEPHAAHALHDLDNRGHVAVLGIAPRRAHAEALAARILGLRRALEHSLHVHQLGRLDARVRVHRL